MSKRWFALRERVSLTGIMPERALVKLKRAGIVVENVQKPQKNQLLFTVKRKDIEKVFAIYPDVCYNIDGYSPYTAKRLGGVGAARVVDFFKKRVGFFLGILLFCAFTLFADSFVFGVEIVGSNVYAREAYAYLEEVGVKPFSPYKTGVEKDVCAKLLALDGVEYCSVQKRGGYVRVEIRTSPYLVKQAQAGDMIANRTGVITSIAVLKGTPLKKAGERVTAGETLVGGYFATESGERKETFVSARVKLVCEYEKLFVDVDGETAFAQAYLELGLGEADEIVRAQTWETDGGTFVRMEYSAIVTMNF